MALGSKYVHYERRGAVAWVRFDRPEARNAFTQEMYMAVVKACEAADADPGIQLTVLTGTGDVFSPGGDLRGAGGFIEDPSKAEIDLHSAPVVGPGGIWEVDPFLAVESAHKLVVAAVNGICQAGGLVMALAADLVIASDQATFRVPELLRGVADAYVPTRLPLYVGFGRAKQMMFTCASYSAQQALEWGLVSEVVPHEEFEARTEQFLERVLRTAPEARAAYKSVANQVIPQPDYAAFSETIRSDEHQEGSAAFAERRAPSWVPAVLDGMCDRL